MITKRFTIYTKFQKILLGMADIVQGAVGLTIITIILIAMFVSQKELSIWNIIVGLGGIIGLIDVIINKVLKSNNAFLHKVLINFFRTKMVFFKQTPMQAEVCSWINAKILNKAGILIYGKTNVGKTSSIFIYLSQYTKNKDLLHQLNWTESIIYIDCKNNKNEILNFFSYKGKYFKNNMFEKTLIVVDNLELMGKTFFENLLQIVNSTTGTFILLVDAYQLNDDFNNKLEQKYLREDCISLISNSDHFKESYINLTSDEKIIFLIIYYVSLSVTLIPIKDIFNIVNGEFSFIRFRMKLNTLSRKGLIKKFPFDRNYILLTNRINILKEQQLFWDTAQNSEAISKMLNNSNKFPESAWLSMIHLSYEQLSKLDVNKKETLFSNALTCGNYFMLHKTLQDELIYCPVKERLFLYELGTLFFYNNMQDQAFKNYNRLINETISDKVKYATMLRIIEATHGDINFSTIQNINNYLSALTSRNNEYELYAKYWMLHIESERGNFCINEFNNLLFALTSSEDLQYTNDIQIEIIKRCYTDIIRSSHILYREPSNSIITEFLSFMDKNYDKAMCQYYKNLYVDANTLHYIQLLKDILCGGNCKDTYDKAVAYYNAAIQNGTERQKSVKACEIKSIDLQLFDPQNMIKFEIYQEKIENYLSNAEINKVSVHVAYCKTLLAKLYMVKNLQDTEYFVAIHRKINNSTIKAYLRESKSIYQKYQNEYGVIRIEFLENLYNFATLTSEDDRNKSMQKISNIVENHQEYQREKDILDFLQNDGKSSRMSVISIIKAYPIIMQ